MEAITIRECTTIDELDRCVRLQRDVFGLPDLEISPRRHLIVSRHAGGWTLGAFLGEQLVGFVHHLVGVRENNEIFGYSHMMAVARAFQNKGVGAQLKWAQRDKALAQGHRFIKWTWDPMQARNAHFNLNRLGVTVHDYAENFYGTDYVTDPEQRLEGPPGLKSDRLFASWDLLSSRVECLASGEKLQPLPAARTKIAVPADWGSLIKADIGKARREQERVRNAFKEGFAAGLMCAGFEREATGPSYLLYESQQLV
jgi:predicted GNAT superfamily acetyltransferase